MKFGKAGCHRICDLELYLVTAEAKTKKTHAHVQIKTNKRSIDDSGNFCRIYKHKLQWKATSQL